MIEWPNGSLQVECLNVNWFLSLEGAKEKIESWRQNYNRFRLDSSLDAMMSANALDSSGDRGFHMMYTHFHILSSAISIKVRGFRSADYGHTKKIPKSQLVKSSKMLTTESWG